MPTDKTDRPLTADELDLAFAIARAQEAGLVSIAKDPVVNTIYLHESMLESILKDVFTFGCTIAMSAFGQWLNNTALEWVGSWLVFLFVAGWFTRYKKCRTIPEARAELDRIEKQGRF